MPPKTVYDHLPPVERQAAKILDRLYHLGSECTKRKLARSMSAHKKPMWPSAFEFLVRRGYVRLTPLGSRRQVLVTLVDIPQRLEPKPIILKKKIKRRRPQTEWFKKNFPKFLERDGYIDGPERDAIPRPEDNVVEDPSGLPGGPLFFERPQEFAADLAEPPGWRRRHNDEDL